MTVGTVFTVVTVVSSEKNHANSQQKKENHATSQKKFIFKKNQLLPPTYLPTYLPM